MEKEGGKSKALLERSSHDINKQVVDIAMPTKALDRDGTVLPLANPNQQMRLLRLDLGAGHDDVSGCLLVFNRGHTPPYAAISYTWGSSRSAGAIINIDGHLISVRKNCSNALRLARYHVPSECFVWIDSICINQEDLEEKAAQVKIMYDIYHEARSVLACLGERTVSSDFVFDMLEDSNLNQRVFEQLERVYEDDGNKASPQELRTSSYELDNDSSDATDFWEHWQTFCNASYFQRTWIVQELHAGRGRTRFACGHRSADLEHLFRLNYQLAFFFDSEGQSVFFTALDRVIIKLEAGKSSQFSLAMIMVHPAVCEDPRDQIYANIRLLEWDRFGLQQPSPDYTISTLELGLQALNWLFEPFLGDSRSIPRALKLNNHTAVMQSRLRASHDHHPVRRQWRLRVLGSSRLTIDNVGRFTTKHFKATDERRWTIDAEETRRAMDARYCKGAPAPFGAKTRLTVYSESGECAFVPQHTLAGDILVMSETSLYFVLRPSDDNTIYTFIGWAIVVNGHQPLTSAYWTCDCERLWPMWEGERSQVTLGVDLSTTEALLLGAILGREPEEEGNDVACLLDLADSHVLARGAIVRDISLKGQTREIIPLGKKCPDHGDINYASIMEGALRCALETQSGACVGVRFKVVYA